MLLHSTPSARSRCLTPFNKSNKTSCRAVLHSFPPNGPMDQRRLLLQVSTWPGHGLPIDGSNHVSEISISSWHLVCRFHV